MVVYQETSPRFGNWARNVALLAKSANVGRLNFRIADAILAEGDATLRLPHLGRRAPKRDDLYCKMAAS